jgi:hypothetical protein
MRARIGRRAWRTASQDDRRSCFKARFGLSPPLGGRGLAPPPPEGAPTSSALSVGVAYVAPTRLQLLGSARSTFAARYGLGTIKRRSGTPGLGPRRWPGLALRRSSAVSELASSGGARARLRLRAVALAARSSSLASTRACGSGSSASHPVGLRCLGPKTGWQPARRRLDRAGSADLLPSLRRAGGLGTLSVEGGQKWGVRGRAVGWSSVLRWAPRTGHWASSFRPHVSGMPARLTGRCSRSAVGRHARRGRGRDVRSPPRAESPRASRATLRRGRPSSRAATRTVHPNARSASPPRSQRTGAAGAASDRPSRRTRGERPRPTRSRAPPGRPSGPVP